MDHTVPWQEITELIVPHYHSSNVGRHAVPLECMLRMYFLQVWFSLSDRDTEDALNDIISMRDFSRIDFPAWNPPDATTLLHFRHILEKNDLCRQIFGRVKTLLLDKGLMWKGGTILDATIVSAPKFTRNEGNLLSALSYILYFI
jgi:IS5 family transposase